MADYRCSGCEKVLDSRICTIKPYICDTCYKQAVRLAKDKAAATTTKRLAKAIRRK